MGRNCEGCRVIAVGVYIISLCVGAGIFGGYASHALGTLGYVCDSATAFRLTMAAAFAFAAAQLAYMAFVRLLRPTVSRVPLFTEAASQLAALVFVPYLQRAPIPFEAALSASLGSAFEYVVQLQPLIYLGAFIVIHGFLKLLSFFAATRGEPAVRWPGTGWAIAAGFCAVFAFGSMQSWLNALEAQRPAAQTEAKEHRVGDTLAVAHELPEGTQFSAELPEYDGGSLVLRWANTPAAESLENAYVTVTFEGAHAVGDTDVVPLTAGQWSELRIPPDAIPADMQRCSVAWFSKKPPAWLKFMPVQPVKVSNKKLLLSGPFVHETRDASKRPNILIVAVDGLGAASMSCLGYERPTTPNLDRFARRGMLFSNAYTPAPETPAACMTLLTGLSPLRHGYLDQRHGPLSNTYATLATLLREQGYATAAFTECEGQTANKLAYGTGFEQGFELYDPSFHPAPTSPDESAAAAHTLDKARAWIEAHADDRFFVFVRLHELDKPQWHERYAPGLVSESTTPNPADIYDSALAYVDTHIGQLVDSVRGDPASRDTAIIITSTYGLDAEQTPRLTEECLRVPLLLDLPAGRQVEEDEKDLKLRLARPVALADVFPTVLKLARINVKYKTEGRDLVGDHSERVPISMAGDPLVLSLRKQPWRFTWRSGLHPFTYTTAGPSAVVEFYNIERAKLRGHKDGDAQANAGLIIKYEEYLRNYLAKVR